LERFPKIGEEIILKIKNDENQSNKALQLKILSLEKNTIGEIKTEIVKIENTK
jgi:hypothetical protein